MDVGVDAWKRLLAYVGNLFLSEELLEAAKNE
jgi:hypothetical protein